MVTYTALISAYERGGQWQKALKAFQRMLDHELKPDAIVYNAIIDCLWGTGITWAQARGGRLGALCGLALVQDVPREPVSRRACAKGRCNLTVRRRPSNTSGGVASATAPQFCDPLPPPSLPLAPLAVRPQGCALQLFLGAVQQGHFRQEPLVRVPALPGAARPRAELNVHAMTAGVAMVSLFCWLTELRCAPPPGCVGMGQGTVPASEEAAPV